MLGRVLKNRFKLIDERGRGSMATVYIGRDLETNCIYAVKVLSREAAADEELSERFQREFELLSRLSGPHIVRTVDFGEDRGNLFIVMDYVDGHNLKHSVLTGGPFPISSAIDAMQQATAAIANASMKSIIHRDVKPQNLLRGVDSVVKLTDFGLARSHESRDITVTGYFVGTPFYVAPEQVENSRMADTRSDLYSLGCVFFETLTGRVPFEGDHAWDVVMQHMKAPIPSACALRRELAPAFDEFFEVALAKKPEDRFQTPQEFSAALNQLPQADVVPPREGVTSRTLAPSLDATPQIDAVAQVTADPAVPGQPLIWGLTHGSTAFLLSAPDLVVGRSDPQRGHAPDIDLLPLDNGQTVSRRHARILQRDGRVYIEDLNAYNRTCVNGIELVPHQEAELHEGDLVRLGNIELRVETRQRALP